MSKIAITDLKPNEPITTDDAILEIVMDGGELPVGPHIFQLIITDENGNRSQPVQAQVIILDRQAPTAVLDVLPSSEVDFGGPFTLSAERSVGIRQGEKVTYEWTLLRRG